jgi:hypothetical protein
MPYGAIFWGMDEHPFGIHFGVLMCSLCYQGFDPWPHGQICETALPSVGFGGSAAIPEGPSICTSTGDIEILLPSNRARHGNHPEVGGTSRRQC